MTFLGSHQLHGGVYVFFTKCPLRNTLVDILVAFLSVSSRLGR